MAPTGTSSVLAAVITSVLASGTTTPSPTSTIATSASTTSSSPTSTSSADAAAEAAKHKRTLYIALFNPGSLLVYCAVVYFLLKLIKYWLVAGPRRHRAYRNQSRHLQQRENLAEGQWQEQWATVVYPTQPIRAHDGSDPDRITDKGDFEQRGPVPIIGMVGGDDTTNSNRGWFGWARRHQPSMQYAPGYTGIRPRNEDASIPLHTIIPNGPGPRDSESIDVTTDAEDRRMAEVAISYAKNTVDGHSVSETDGETAVSEASAPAEDARPSARE
ncbi:hypothetical protein SEUCBS139899_004498 [Sporothrix eucalyptigena]|uniref:Uncharacterized protein n=1 Tax=Sporothrix eucalyptigena TaxID=1812306 RepID=A0ABP0BHJ3_9PEZI